MQTCRKLDKKWKLKEQKLEKQIISPADKPKLKFYLCISVEFCGLYTVYLIVSLMMCINTMIKWLLPGKHKKSLCLYLNKSSSLNIFVLIWSTFTILYLFTYYLFFFELYLRSWGTWVKKKMKNTLKSLWLRGLYFHTER